MACAIDQLQLGAVRAAMANQVEADDLVIFRQCWCDFVRLIKRSAEAVNQDRGRAFALELEVRLDNIG
jgi:hypothetical protein